MGVGMTGFVRNGGHQSLAEGRCAGFWMASVGPPSLGAAAGRAERASD